MKNVIHRVGRFIRSEDGPTAVEYAVMLALIMVAAITIVSQLGGTLTTTFSTIDSELSGTT